VRAAQDKARELGAPMTVTVVDEAGRLVLCARGDGTGFFTPETSRAKAVAAANFRIATAEMAERAQKRSPFWTSVPMPRSSARSCRARAACPSPSRGA
jgi:glc operon protein GlcG